MLSLADLDVGHLAHFRRAMFNVLCAPGAEFTFAQINDGQPTSNVYEDDHYFREVLPVMHHENMCPGSIEKTRAFRSGFDIFDLKFDAKAIQAYQDTVLGTAAWKLRLLELVTTACYDISVYLYQMDDGVRKHAEHEAWRENKLKTLYQKTI